MARTGFGGHAWSKHALGDMVKMNRHAVRTDRYSPLFGQFSGRCLSGEENFLRLAVRLIEYAKSIDKAPTEALIALSGMSDTGKNDEKQTARQLCALHRFLSEALTDEEAPDFISPEGASEGGGNVGEARGFDHTRNRMLGIDSVTKALRRKRGSGLGVAGCLTVAGSDGLSESDIMRAASYAVEKVIEEQRSGLCHAGKQAERVEVHVEDAKQKLKSFRQMVVQERFDIDLQPTPKLQTNAPQRYKAFARFNESSFEGSPSKMIRFAEDVGMVQDFDSVMTMKVISLIRRFAVVGIEAKIAVNISPKSLQSAEFVRNLLRILDDAADVHGKLSFELMTSGREHDTASIHTALALLHARGYKVEREDLGSSASNLDHLQAFDMDRRKIDSEGVKHV